MRLSQIPFEFHEDVANEFRRQHGVTSSVENLSNYSIIDDLSTRTQVISKRLLELLRDGKFMKASEHVNALNSTSVFYQPSRTYAEMFSAQQEEEGENYGEEGEQEEEDDEEDDEEEEWIRAKGALIRAKGARIRMERLPAMEISRLIRLRRNEEAIRTEPISTTIMASANPSDYFISPGTGGS